MKCKKIDTKHGATTVMMKVRLRVKTVKRSSKIIKFFFFNCL